jgi:hypothetical protein
MRQVKELRPYCIPTTRIKPDKLQKKIKLNPSSRMMQERERNLLLEHDCQNGPWTAAKIEDSDKTKHPPGQVSVGRNEEESSWNAIAESISIFHRPRSPSHRRLPTSQLLSWDRYSLRLFLKKTNAQATNPAHANPHNNNNNNREKPSSSSQKARADEGVRLRFRQDPRRKSPSVSPLANRDSENFYFFAGGARPWLLLQFLRPAWSPPLRRSDLSLPSRPYFSLLFLIFFFSTSLINKTIKESKTSKKKTFN